jgi:hypothetical protein
VVARGRRIPGPRLDHAITANQLHEVNELPQIEDIRAVAVGSLPPHLGNVGPSVVG